MGEYKKIHAESISKPNKFWGREASELHWIKKWTKVLEWKLPHAKWFVGGKINASQNCLDRHLDTPRANKAAIIWEGEPGEKRVLTYRQLHRDVCKFANVLKRNGVKRGSCPHLHAINSRGIHRHARLCEDWRRPFGSVWWI